ncbi:MAG: putative LPS assembly protein LptD [Ignavibacteria bacterium]|nr:putative LPS assembly protein LptD [Ignavibacteria bacterium]
MFNYLWLKIIILFFLSINITPVFGLVSEKNIDGLGTNLFAFQNPPEAPKKKIKNIKTPQDTANILLIDTLQTKSEKETQIENVLPKENFTKDTTKPKATFDDIIKFSSLDSIRFNVKQKHLYLRGKAQVQYKTQKLEAEIIEFYFDKSLLRAQGSKNSEGKYFGYPAFTDNQEVYYGEKISYNFKSKQGTITLGETQLGEGFYFGDKIKRENEREFFVQNGCYTTCNAPHPHYYFGSPKMKVVAGESVYLDPLIFYVEDLPIFILPIGLYFPNRSGRQSGLIAPSFFFSQTRGVAIENLGLYLALSDYYDTRFTFDFYSKGGFLSKNYTQWKYRNIFDGNLELSFGRVRFSVDQPYQKTWSFAVRHNHKINPFENFNADVRFFSQDYFRNTSFDIFTRQQQDLTSNASYSRTFENGSSLSLAYSRSQNILTTAYTETPSISFTVPQINPLRSFAPDNEFLRSISFQYSVRAYHNKSKRERDSTFAFDYSTKISHSPTISFQLPKIYYFTFTPFFNFSFNNYFRRTTKAINPIDSTLSETVENGVFTEYNYSFGISSTTKLYGIAKPNLLGVKMVRHTVSPSIQFSYTPNLSNPKYGFYGKYLDFKSNREIVYSRFEKDGGGLASRSLYQLLSYSIQNNISVKYNPTDTGEDKTIDILNANISGNYNFAADSLKFSDISLSIYTTTIPSLSVNSSLGFTLYDQEPILDASGKPTNSYHKVNRFLISSGKGLIRLTYFTLSLSTKITGGKIPSTPQSGEKQTDSLSLGERFSLRRNIETKEFDFWGENTLGYQPFQTSWSLSFDVNYNYRRDFVNQKSQSLNISLDASFKLTPTWNVFLSTQFDAINKEIVSPVIRINKDLHCWDLAFTWYPYGSFTGFYFRFGIKSSVLRDLKIEKRSSPLY